LADEEGTRVEFDFHGRHVVLEVNGTGSAWDSDDLIDELDDFTSKNLTGDFVELPTLDSLRPFVYLPRVAASELHTLIEQTRDEFLRADLTTRTRWTGGQGLP
jgi:hypothetical protein